MSIHLNLPGSGKRLIFDLTPWGFPEIPYLAAQNLPFTAASLPMHTHKERMEINHLLKGERTYLVDGKYHHLRGNEIFITWPYELHGTGAYLHGRGLHFWMQAVIPKPGQPFLSYSARLARPLLEAIWDMPRRQFKADPGLRDIYSRMLAICRSGPSKLGGIELSSLLTQWFLLLAKGSARDGSDEIAPDIVRALDIMAKANYRDISVEDLAAAACLSESRFKGKFREQMGVPPWEYLLRRRTELAAELLMQGKMSLTEIALEAGFSSGQHFSLTFKKFIGLSPLAWQKRQAADTLHQTARTLHLTPTSAPDDTPTGASLRPWLDDTGFLHGYVSSSHKGQHPNC